MRAHVDILQVNISTIAGSRHVGPIRPRVEDWGKKLSLFAETLVQECKHVYYCLHLQLLLIQF